MQNTGLIKVSSYIVHVDRFGLQVCMYEHMHAHVRCLVYSPWFSFDIYIYIYIYIYGGKQWQTTPKNLPRMQRTRAIPVT